MRVAEARAEYVGHGWAWVDDGVWFYTRDEGRAPDDSRPVEIYELDGEPFLACRSADCQQYVHDAVKVW